MTPHPTLNFLYKRWSWRNYFIIKTGVQYETWSNINYGSNYNEIFQYYSPELDGQMPVMNELYIHWSSRLFSKTNYGDRNNKFLQDDGFVNRIEHCK